MKRKDKMDTTKRRSFRDLGLPEALIQEHEDASTKRFELRDPPQELVDQTIKEICMEFERNLYCRKGYVAEIRRNCFGEYVAIFLDFPTLVARSKTLKGAKENIEDAGRMYLSDLVKEGKEFPKPTYRAENLLLNTPMDYLTGRRNYRITFDLNK